MLDPGQDAAGSRRCRQRGEEPDRGRGTLKHENVWGLRKMAYEIDQRNEADYRWFRFEAPTELLEQLDHNLKIADGVLRFRIFKVDADTPVMVPPATSAPGPAASRERPAEARRRRQPRTDGEAEPIPPAAPSPSPSRPPRRSPPPRLPEAAVAEAPAPAAEPEAPEAPPEDAEGEPGDSAA